MYSVRIEGIYKQESYVLPIIVVVIGEIRRSSELSAQAQISPCEVGPISPQYIVGEYFSFAATRPIVPFGSYRGTRCNCRLAFVELGKNYTTGI